MIHPTIESLRLFLHVLAASVWVGGQIVLAALVPVLRTSGEGALQSVARAFGRVAWPSFVIALLTGVWNLWAVQPSQHGSAYLVTLAIKLGVVAVAAIATIIHSTSRTRLGLAIGGAVGLVSSLGALWLGVLLAQAG